MNHQPGRRRILCAALSTLTLASTLPAMAWAQADYPARPVTLVVSFPPGSGADTTARIYAKRLQEITKQSFVVENRPGGESFIAAQAVARAKPDGYTLFFSSNALTLHPALFKRLPYDPVGDFAPVALASRGTNVIVVATGSPYKNFGDLVSAAKKQPNAVTFGAGGQGYRVYVELLAESVGVKFQDVPYKGAGPALMDAAAGVVDFSIGDPSAVASLVKGGKLRALAVAADKRHPMLPDVPTGRELGAPAFELYSWTALYAPAKTPQPVIEKLAGWMRMANNNPETVAAMEKLGIEVFSGGPDDLRRFQASETERWKRTVARAGIQPAE